ncbi:hypothetical protein HCN44_006876 [Aphidius gifuensis]|uniref:Calcium channel flower n=1 Tax=Aphidius gifuensis TaxID=684658 RepID=A0A834Y2C8_APHGI|nr:calcium channel flower isoform X2 [Aphidius gifuensis]KAF7995769.1 hypothetical protein HCN44_006876 [Aphidius gifuensis]
MSFSEKIASIMERPGQDPQSQDDVPWWMKYGARAMGTVGGFFGILFGAFSCLTIIVASIPGFLSGVTLIIAGLVVLTGEAPCCCIFLDFVQTLSNIIEKRPYWNRAVLYCGLAVLPLFLDFSFGKFLASGLIFGTGVLYGMMSIGKKASIDEMRSAAVDSTIPTSSMKGNLVENAQPMSFSNKPDSNV